MQAPEEKRIRRSQRDYRLAFKLAVVGEVARTEGYNYYQNALAKRVIASLKEGFLFILPDDLAQASLLVQQAVHLYNEERPR